jgi:hypothetical protein
MDDLQKTTSFFSLFPLKILLHSILTADFSAVLRGVLFVLHTWKKALIKKSG